MGHTIRASRALSAPQQILLEYPSGAVWCQKQGTRIACKRFPCGRLTQRTAELKAAKGISRYPHLNPLKSLAAAFLRAPRPYARAAEDFLPLSLQRTGISALPTVIPSVSKYCLEERAWVDG